MAIYRQGRQAAKTHDYKKAIEYYSQGLAFDDTPPLFRARLLEYRGESHWLLCNFDKACRDYDEALTTCEDPEQLARIRIRLSEVANFQGEYQRSHALCQQALEEGIAANSVVVTAWARHGLGITLCQQGNTEQSLTYLTQALAAFRTMGEAREQARILTSIGRTHLVRGEFQRSLQMYQEALHIFRSLNDRWRVVETLSDIGNCHQGLYDVENSVNFHERALKLAQEQRVRLFLPKIECGLGVALIAQGQIESGVAYLLRALVGAKQLDAREQEVMSLYHLTQTYMHQLDDANLASHYAASLADVTDQLKAERLCALTAFVYGELAVVKGERETAVSYLNKAMVCAQTAVDRSILWQLHATMSRIIDNPDIAAVHLNIAAEFIRQTVAPLQDPHLKNSFIQAPAVANILAAAGVDASSL
ncbi:MAG: tetratricopeptide repeat protein [Chloroflexota bacterium]